MIVRDRTKFYELMGAAYIQEGFGKEINKGEKGDMSDKTMASLIQ